MGEEEGRGEGEREEKRSSSHRRDQYMLFLSVHILREVIKI